jgi:hypothetical protein
LQAIRRRFRNGQALAGLWPALLGLVVGSCAFGDDIVRPPNRAVIAIHVAFAPTSAPSVAERSRVDRLRVLVIRPATRETLGQAEEPVAAGEESVPVELSVELETSPEELLVRVELWSGDLLVYAGEQLMLVDAARDVNESPQILLRSTSPSLDLQPPSLVFTLPPGSSTASEPIRIGNVGVGLLSWEASGDAPWLTLSPTAATVAADGTATVLATVSAAGLDTGTYEGSVIVTAPGTLGSPGSVAVTLTIAPDQAPVANAGPDQVLTDTDDSGDQAVTLDGSGSFDPDGPIVGYAWTEGDTPIASGARPTITLDVGVHVLTLTVTDGPGLTDTDEVQVAILPPEHRPPRADAGLNRTVTDVDGSGDEAVTLDGSPSFDPDGSIVAYAWTEGGTPLASGATPTVTLAVGVHVLTLTVTDDDGLTDSDQVQITVAPPGNLPPEADAGPDQTVIDVDDSGDEAVLLDGSASLDPDGSIVDWDWTEAGASIASGATPSVTLGVGTHLITLTVTDDGGLTGSDQVQVTVRRAAPPDLVAGAPEVTPASPTTAETVSIEALITNAGSTPSGTFAWRLRVGTTTVASGSASLEAGGTTTVSATGLGPYAEGSYTATLDVDYDDAVGESNESNNTASTAFTVTPPPDVTLTVVVDGIGSVGSSGVTPALDCSYVEGTCSQAYPVGTPVTLTATSENPDFVFESWYGTGAGFTCTTDPTCIVTMDEDRTVRAWFSSPGMLSVDPGAAAFTMVEGNPASPPSHAITVSNVGERTVHDVEIHQSYSPEGEDWLSATLDRTEIDTLTAGTMTLSVNPNGLAPGTYNATVSVGDFVITTADVSVTLTVTSAAPTISDLSIELLQVNDSVNCSANKGSRYRASFNYADPDGDATAALAIIRDDFEWSDGNSGSFVWPGAGSYTWGDGFSGSFTVTQCIAFYLTTSLMQTFTVEDGAGHLSNALSATVTPPPGANVPPPGGSAPSIGRGRVGSGR